MSRGVLLWGTFALPSAWRVLLLNTRVLLLHQLMSPTGRMAWPRAVRALLTARLAPLTHRSGWLCPLAGHFDWSVGHSGLSVMRSGPSAGHSEAMVTHSGPWVNRSDPLAGCFAAKPLGPLRNATALDTKSWSTESSFCEPTLEERGRSAHASPGGRRTKLFVSAWNFFSLCSLRPFQLRRSGSHQMAIDFCTPALYDARRIPMDDRWR